MQQDLTKRKKAALESLSAAQHSYNSSLLYLINICVEKKKKDQRIQDIKNMFRTINAIDSSIVIRETGPYVWRYREILSKKDESFFSDMEGVVKKEINEYYKGPNAGEKFSQNDVQEILKVLHSGWNELTKPEKQVIWTYATTLLTSFAQYLGAERELNKISAEIKALSMQK